MIDMLSREWHQISNTCCCLHHNKQNMGSQRKEVAGSDPTTTFSIVDSKTEELCHRVSVNLNRKLETNQKAWLET